MIEKIVSKSRSYQKISPQKSPFTNKQAEVNSIINQFDKMRLYSSNVIPRCSKPDCSNPRASNALYCSKRCEAMIGRDSAYSSSNATPQRSPLVKNQLLEEKSRRNLFQDFNDSESQFVDFQINPFGQATALDRFYWNKDKCVFAVRRPTKMRQSKLSQLKVLHAGLATVSSSVQPHLRWKDTCVKLIAC